MASKDPKSNEERADGSGVPAPADAESRSTTSELPEGLGEQSHHAEQKEQLELEEPSKVDFGRDSAELQRFVRRLRAVASARAAGREGFVEESSFAARLAELQLQIADKARELEAAQVSVEESQRKKEEFEALVASFEQKDKLNHLLTRVGTSARKRLLADSTFSEKFSGDEDCLAFVVSVDIRRSTELMLKARSAEAFASFISALCDDLYGCIVDNYGVFEKFTGDGVLAFFPVQYSGLDAAYFALKAAKDCHAAFENRYRMSRGTFSSVLRNVGLGIGIDYGCVRLLRVAEGLAVVGVPVVYACRFSSAPSGVTLLNQPAYERALESLAGTCSFAEEEIDVKHEGPVVAYSFDFVGTQYVPRVPDWERN